VGIRVAELIPGQRVTLTGLFGGRAATFVARTEHPIWPSLQLVIWWLHDGAWSHDALHAQQDLGVDPEPSTADERLTNLRIAILGRP
jgi:hypothetical protein